MRARRQKFRIAVRKFDPFDSAIQKQWASFDQQERSGLTAEIESLDLGPLHHTLFESKGLRNGDWDVAFLNTDWLAEANDTGSLVDLAPYLETDPPEDYPEGWTDSLLRLQRFDQRVLGLPYHDGPECLIYRRDLFEIAAVEPPRTWDEFHSLARFFTRPQSSLYGAVFAALPDGHNTVYDFCVQLWTRDGALFDQAGRMSLDSPQAAAALQFYRDMLSDAGAIHPRCREFDSVAAGRAFADGEVAMMVNWFGFATLPQTIAESPARGNVAVAPIPGTAARSGSLNVYWILAITSGSPHRDIAWRFLRHCAGPAMDRLLTLEGGIGCRKSTWCDAEVNAAIPIYHRLARLHADTHELPRLANWSQLAGVIDAMILEAIDTNERVVSICARAQARAGRLLPAESVRGI